ncbi:hypothetical protein ACFSDD_21000 [Salipiger marinus]|nr:hypothetical protein [Salipiger manganoxidans]MEB3417877.1 hypothetical protein [Salipiger manganoxidans]
MIPALLTALSRHYLDAYAVLVVGPRGGAYTITASGNKNYGGC